MSPDALSVGVLAMVTQPWQLPTNWVWAPLGLLTAVISRGRAPIYVNSGGVLVLNQRCIRWDKIDFGYAKQTSESSFHKYPGHLVVQDGDILWNSTGSGTIGRAAIYRSSEAANGPILIDTHISIVRCAHCLPEYVSRFLSTLHVQKIISDLNVGSTNQLELPRSVIAELQVPLPPISEQRRIVARIDELFAEIAEGEAALKRARQGLDTWRRALLKAAVTGELTRDWREANRPAETGADLLARIRTERDARTHGSGRRRGSSQRVPMDTISLPTLPEGWVWASLGDLFEITTGSTPSRAEPLYWGGTIPWVSSGEVAFCRIKKTRECVTSIALRGSSNRIHQPGTVLLAMIGEGKTRGQCAILDIAACNNQNSAAIRVGSTSIEPQYIYYVLQERYYRSRKESQGGNQPALNGQKVASMAIPLPSLEEINEIVRRLDYFSTLAEAVEHECVEANATQSKLRQSILKAAFGGRLVSQDPADETAAELLARLHDNSPTNGARRRRARAAPDFSHPSFPGLTRQSVDPRVEPTGDG
jgi:type I restriction enzyme S subunit